MENKKTVVIFRQWRAKSPTDRTVIALFPEIEASPGKCMAYEHAGQHAGADYQGVMTATRAAYSCPMVDTLVKELEAIGYILDIKRRKPAVA